MKTLGPLIRTTFVIVVLDQLTKLLVVHVMALKDLAVIPVYHPYLMFRMAWNEGINFGIPLANKWGLIALAGVICLWIIVWMVRDKPGMWAQISAGLVVGGAIGNVIDRLAYGAVADFLNMSCCGWENPWSFNVADIAIFLGAVGLIFLTPTKQRAADEAD
ncbi:MAG: signal peptidase II [Silicimonas sp.]|nr:signal peptidase II [Silicimonas sp.]